MKPGFYRFSNSSREVYECKLFSPYGAHCQGGKRAGDASCKAMSEGPLCVLCKTGYFHPSGTEACEECEDASIARTLVPVLVVSFVLALVALAWHVKAFSRVRAKIEFWASKYSVNIEWVAIGGRIVFFDYQIITKFTESKI